MADVEKCPNCERRLSAWMSGNMVDCAAHLSRNFQQDCDVHTIRLLRRKVGTLEELLMKWELFGSEISGCTNHNGEAALADARAGMERHIGAFQLLSAKASEKSTPP